MSGGFGISSTAASADMADASEIIQPDIFDNQEHHQNNLGRGTLKQANMVRSINFRYALTLEVSVLEPRMSVWEWK
jgi:hypothetical protein